MEKIIRLQNKMAKVKRKPTVWKFVAVVNDQAIRLGFFSKKEAAIKEFIRRGFKRSQLRITKNKPRK